MSIVHSSIHGWYITHASLINTFYASVETENELKDFKINPTLFQIDFPFKNLVSGRRKKRKHKLEDMKVCNLTKDIEHVKCVYDNLKKEITHLFLQTSDKPNSYAFDFASKVYAESHKASPINFLGENASAAKFCKLNECNFLFPSNCKFYCKDVTQLSNYLANVKYDMVLMDPPWWNKYIRRKRSKSNDAYDMMYNDDIKALPIDKLLTDDGVVIVWCTNSQQHLNSLVEVFFVQWNVAFVAKMFWLKITNLGEPVCDYSDPPGKQPFEQIIVGAKNPETPLKSLDGKLIISVPSALHSHKPPLINILTPFLPKDPNCLEIFARYLLPNWTSWGLEVLHFQHESLYIN
ncbi:hypothetical protein FQA39_LY13612 [Lamprigera yunnana]|nr:hypothetical protein FQA39_LY13612 [Lamprigera yunnana]